MNFTQHWDCDHFSFSTHASASVQIAWFFLSLFLSPFTRSKIQMHFSLPFHSARITQSIFLFSPSFLFDLKPSFFWSLLGSHLPPFSPLCQPHFLSISLKKRNTSHFRIANGAQCSLCKVENIKTTKYVFLRLIYN